MTKEEIIIPIVNSIQEIEKLLLGLDDEFRKIKMIFNERRLLFTREEKDNKPYFIQRLENNFYGRVFYNNMWFYSYPHLSNIKDNTVISMESSYLEEKINGTNIGIGRYPGIDIVRTRMNPFPEEFPVTTFWNSTIESIIRPEIRSRLTAIKNEMLTKYPNWYINAGDGVYVGLKVQEVVKHIINVNEILTTYPNYIFYFELIGKINPIIIDTDVEFGLYDFDYAMVLFDIFDMKNETFLSRLAKEHISQKLNIQLIPVRFTFNTIKELTNSISSIKQEAETQKIEGYVLKNEINIIKVKPDIILQSAYRLNSILKGHIYTPDLLNYISKVITSDYLSKPEEYDNLVDLIKCEAEADYSEDVIIKNTSHIRKKIAEAMAVMMAVKIMKEQTFEDKSDLFRYLNMQIPIRFAPLKTYIDFELEKSTEDVDIRKKMKNRRKSIFNKVSKYCINQFK